MNPKALIELVLIRNDGLYKRVIYLKINHFLELFDSRMDLSGLSEVVSLLLTDFSLFSG